MLMPTKLKEMEHICSQNVDVMSKAEKDDFVQKKPEKGKQVHSLHI